MGSKGRAEKVRTYNFKDDYVTDHRVGKSWKRVTDIMRGDVHLQDIITALDDASKAQNLEEIFNSEVTCTNASSKYAAQ